MTLYQISEDVDVYYRKMSHRERAWWFIGLIALLILLLGSIGYSIYSNYQKQKAIAEYQKLLEESHQNYYLQSISNSNLEKKLQDLMLEIATLRNSTIELERMIMELSDEKVNLEEIRRQMELGIRRTKTQLDNMQSSVNSLINQRTKAIIYTEDEIIREKSDTHGK